MINFNTPDPNELSLFDSPKRSKKAKLGNINDQAIKLPQNYYTWATLPDALKLPQNVKPYSKLAADPANAELQKLMIRFVASDDLRPTMNYMFFDQAAVIASDAHKLVYLPYSFLGKCDKKHIGKMFHPVTGKEFNDPNSPNATFPKYASVIPTSNDYTHTIDCLALKTFVTASEYFINDFSKLIKLSYSDDSTLIGFKSSFLIHILDFFLLLGYNSVKVGLSMPSRAVMFYPEKWDWNGTQSQYPLVLLMPVMIKQDDTIDQTDKVMQQNVDFNKYLLAHFDLAKNKVHSKGKDYAINTKLRKEDIEPQGGLSIEVIKKLAAIKKTFKNTYLPILDYVFIKNNVLRFTNLTVTITTPCHLPDDLYHFYDGALMQQFDQNGMEDYPSEPEGFENIGTIHGAELTYYMPYVERALFYKDEMRPNSNCMNLKLYANDLFLEVGHGHGILNLQIENHNLKKDEWNIHFDKVKPFKQFLALCDGDLLSVSVIKKAENNEITNVCFQSGKYRFIAYCVEATAFFEKTLPNYMIYNCNISNYKNGIVFPKAKLKEILKHKTNYIGFAFSKNKCRAYFKIDNDENETEIEFPVQPSEHESPESRFGLFLPNIKGDYDISVSFNVLNCIVNSIDDDFITIFRGNQNQEMLYIANSNGVTVDPFKYKELSKHRKEKSKRDEKWRKTEEELDKKVKHQNSLQVYLAQYIASQQERANESLSGIDAKIGRFIKSFKGVEKNRVGTCTFNDCQSLDGTKGNACCKLDYNCPKLNDNNCTIYENRPRNCRIFPRSKQDLQLVKNCGYSFE